MKNDFNDFVSDSTEFQKLLTNQQQSNFLQAFMEQNKLKICSTYQHNRLIIC